jgi:hypothetical protein
MEYIIKAIAQANMDKPYPYSGETYNKGDRFWSPVMHVYLPRNIKFLTD